MRLKVKAQLIMGDEIAFGPGRAALLEAIAAEGSISAAARSMGLSYRRAWVMVDSMNRLFAEPLVETRAGGAGGASLSAAGRTVLADYRLLVEALDAVGRDQAACFARLLR